MGRIRFGKHKEFEIHLEQMIKKKLVDDYRNNLPLSHFSTKELFRMKEEIIKNYR